MCAGVDPRDAQFTGGRRQQGGDGIHKGGLARAVGAEQRRDTTGVRHQIEMVERFDVAERLRQALGFDYGGHLCSLEWQRRKVRRTGQPEVIGSGRDHEATARRPRSDSPTSPIADEDGGHGPTNPTERTLNTVTTYDIEYQAAGRRMIGYFAVPTGDGPAAAVLVCHEGPGLDDHAKSRARRLAELGYLALALDYHGDGRPLEGGLPAVRERLAPLLADPLQTRAIGRAGLEVLLGHERCDAGRVAAIGYCFGGTMALELARGGEALQAVVGFHSGLGTARPADAANCTAKVLACIGADDPMVNAEQRAAFEQEMTAGGVDWMLNVYGGAVHSFTNVNADLMGMPQVIAYHEPTDRPLVGGNAAVVCRGRSTGVNPRWRQAR